MSGGKPHVHAKGEQAEGDHAHGGLFGERTELIFALGCGAALLAGWLLGFTLSLDDVVISTFVTGPSFDVLPLKIYSMVRLGLKPEVNALATLLLSISLITLFASYWFSRKNA